MIIDNGIENVDVALKMELPECEYSGQEPGRGSIRITVAMDLFFTGDMYEMLCGFEGMSKEHIINTVIGALVELFGEGITKGGCHVQG